MHRVVAAEPRVAVLRAGIEPTPPPVGAFYSTDANSRGSVTRGVRLVGVRRVGVKNAATVFVQRRPEFIKRVLPLLGRAHGQA
jgi:hypothetical protein